MRRQTIPCFWSTKRTRSWKWVRPGPKGWVLMSLQVGREVQGGPGGPAAVLVAGRVRREGRVDGGEAAGLQLAVSLPPGASRYLIPGDDHRLAPIDNGNVCVNIDTTLVRRPPPRPADARSTTWSSRRTADLIAVPGATTSSTGLAFLLGTIGRYGDGWPTTGQSSLPTARPITDGWTAGLRDRLHPGRRPRRPARSSSPTTPRRRSPSRRARTRRPRRRCSTPASARWSTPACSPARPNPEGAEAFVDFLLSPDVQQALPDAMYVFPVRQRARRCRPPGRSTPSSRRTRYAVEPGRDRRAPRRVAARVERHRQPVTDRRCGGLPRPSPPTAAIPLAGAGRLLRAAGRRAWSARGLRARTATSTSAACSTCSAGPRSSGRSGSRVWSSPRPRRVLACALGLPAAYVLHRLAFPGRDLRSARCWWCRSCCRPSWSASPSELLIGEGGPLGLLGLDGSAGRDRRRAGLLQRRRS